MTQSHYPIGTPGKPWGSQEKQDWLQQQSIKRSYQQEVLSKVMALEGKFTLIQYGELNYAQGSYPLYGLKSPDWSADKPTVLVTGGVHGYETSGVHGALEFAATAAGDYMAQCNLLIVPCISPWGYETINRWNPDAIDPNRSFFADSPAGESAALMAFVKEHSSGLLAHFDLHETTDSDNEEFRPALAARDGTEHDNWNIPDGFYTVGDSENPQADFQQAIIARVEQVTHIAPADENGCIIGASLAQHGVINYPLKKLGLCASVTDAEFVTTTEVYPDSPKSDAQNCVDAQVAAITGGLDYLLNR